MVCHFVCWFIEWINLNSFFPFSLFPFHNLFNVEFVLCGGVDCGSWKGLYNIICFDENNKHFFFTPSHFQILLGWFKKWNDKGALLYICLKAIESKWRKKLSTVHYPLNHSVKGKFNDLCIKINGNEPFECNIIITFILLFYLLWNKNLLLFVIRSSKRPMNSHDLNNAGK